MGIVIKESIKTSIATYCGMTVGAINVLWLSTKYLTTEQIGILKFINEAGFLFAMFATLGISPIIDRFFPSWRDDKVKHQGFFIYALLHVFAGFILFTICFFQFNNTFALFYGEGSPALMKYYQLLLPLTLFISLQAVGEAYLRAHFKNLFAVIVREIFIKVANAGLVVLYAADIITFDQLMFFFVGIFGFAVLMLFAHIKAISRFYLVLPRQTLRLYKDMNVYGFFVIMASMGSMLISRIDVLMLPAMAGINSAGIYTIALMICLAIEVPKKSMFQITTPILTNALKNNDIAKVEELYRKSSINIFTVGLFLFLGIWCNIDAIFQIIPHSEIYREAKYVVFFIGIAKLIDLATSINSEIIYFSKYYKFFMLTSLLLAVSTIVLNRIFIPEYEMLGAAIAMVLSMLIFNIVKSSFVFNKFKIRPLEFKTLLAIMIAVFTWFLTHLLPNFHNPFISILLKSSIVTMVFVTLIYQFKIANEINQVIDTALQRIQKIIG